MTDLKEFGIDIAMALRGLRPKVKGRAFEQLVNIEPTAAGWRAFRPIHLIDGLLTGFDFSEEEYVTDGIDIDVDYAQARLTRDFAFDLGPIAQGDVSLGLFRTVWVARYDDENNIWLQRINPRRTAWEPETLLVSVPGTPISNLSLSWDQQGRSWVSFQQDGWTKLYWYDTVLQDYAIISVVENAHYPFIILDERRASFVGDSDVLMFFWQDTGLKYARQRDRFLDIYPFASPSGVAGPYRLELVAPTEDRRIAVFYSAQGICGMSLNCSVTAPYPHYATEGMIFSWPGVVNLTTVESLYYESTGSLFQFKWPSIVNLVTEEAELVTYTSSVDSQLYFKWPEVVNLTTETTDYVQYTSEDSSKLKFTWPEITNLSVEMADYIQYDRGHDLLQFDWPAILNLDVTEAS